MNTKHMINIGTQETTLRLVWNSHKTLEENLKSKFHLIHDQMLTIVSLEAFKLALQFISNREKKKKKKTHNEIV